MAKTLMQRFEKLHLVTKFLLVGGSAYLLYRQWNKVNLEEEAAKVLKAKAEAADVGPTGATKPLVEQVAAVLPTIQSQALTYGGSSPDQVRTAQKLSTPTPTPLTSATEQGQAFISSIFQ